MFGGGEESGGYYANRLPKHPRLSRYCSDFAHRLRPVMSLVVINGSNSLTCNLYTLLLCVELNLKPKTASFVKH